MKYSVQKWHAATLVTSDSSFSGLALILWQVADDEGSLQEHIFV